MRGGSARVGFKPARKYPDDPEPRDTRGGRGHHNKDPYGGGGSSYGESSDSEPEDDDAQKQHDREIDRKRIDFTITSESIRKARKC